MYNTRKLYNTNNLNLKVFLELFSIFSSGIGITGVLSASFKTLSASLADIIALHPVLTGIIATVASFGAVATVIDQVNNTAKESTEALSNMQSSYNENKSELESLNSELATTQSRMDELQAKGHLTLTEQEELANLQAQNAELERTIALKEAQQKIDARQLAKQAQETYNKYTQAQDLFNRNLGDTEYNRQSVQSYKNNISTTPLAYGSQDRIYAINQNS